MPAGTELELEAVTVVASFTKATLPRSDRVSGCVVSLAKENTPSMISTQPFSTRSASPITMRPAVSAAGTAFPLLSSATSLPETMVLPEAIS